MSSTLKDSQVSIRLPSTLNEQMATYARLTGRTKSYVAMEALTEYLVWRIPQIDDLRQAVLAAEQGKFATDAQVQATFAKYTATKTTASRPKVTRSSRRR